jgi:replicative DNA helicase
MTNNKKVKSLLDWNYEDQIGGVYKRFTQEKDDISLGFPEIEDCFDFKGFPSGTVTLLQGKSKTGKTTLICHSMRYLLDRMVKTIFFSLEMQARLIWQKLFRMILRMHPMQIRELSLIDKNKTLYTIQKNMEFDKYLKIIDSDKIGFVDMDNLIKEFDPEVVFIDHLHLIKPSVVGRGIFEYTMLNSRNLKKLAEGLNKIVFCIVQIGRGESGLKQEDGSVMPGISASYGGSGNEITADAIISLCQPGINPEKKKKQENQVHIQMVGNRNGSMSKRIVYYFSPVTTELKSESQFAISKDFTVMTPEDYLNG